MNAIVSYIRSFFKRLPALIGIGILPCGIEITDQVVRLAYFDGTVWQLSAVRLEPGIVEKGKIKDGVRFVEYLSVLKAKVPGAEGKNKKVDVTLVMGEAAIYNQIFSLPLVQGNNLTNAVQLNMQMASPVEVSKTYSGWQVAGRDVALSRLDILGTFADRATVDAASSALFEAGFVSLAVESKALALARMFREQIVGVDLGASYIMLSIDDVGIDFLVIRAGQLYFEYANPWGDLTDEKGAVSVDRFRETLTVSLRQVMNFYVQHWSDKVAGIIISAMTLADEAQAVIQGELGLPIAMFVPKAYPDMPPGWFAVVGAGLRDPGRKEPGKETNLLGEGAQETFTKDRILRFAAFWRVFIPVACVFFVALFIVADLFLANINASIPPVRISTAAENQDMANLTALAGTFNRSVDLINSVEGSASPKYVILQDVMNAASTNDITVTRFSFTSANNPIILEGEAGAQAQILAFKDALIADPRLASIDLPLTGIQSSDGAYTFSMTFSLGSGTSSTSQ